MDDPVGEKTMALIQEIKLIVLASILQIYRAELKFLIQNKQYIITTSALLLNSNDSEDV